MRDLLVVNPGTSKTLWIKSWNIVTYPLGFLRWWYRFYVPYLSMKARRVVRYLWDFFSLGLLFKNFFKPWKNADNIAGWMTGLVAKLIYLLIFLPLWILLAVTIYALLLLMIFVWFIPFIILGLMISGRAGA